jgi:streptomycin 6-kinase
MNLPLAFVDNVSKAFGERGRLFLGNLPTLLAGAAQRWNLTLAEPFLLSYNYVCAATKADGSPVVLKIGIPNNEFVSEINTLRLYGGKGACRLLEADAEQGLILLERLFPGTMLVSQEDDDLATRIAAGVMRSIHRPAPQETGFLSLRGWFDELSELRPRFGGKTGPFPKRTVEIVETLLQDLLAENSPDVLLHGDFHHYNILSSERGWLVIDPKGVIGPAEYEVGPLLMNPMGDIPPEREAIQRTQHRIAILSEMLGFDRQRLKAWAVCHSLLSAWWDTAEDGTGGEYSLARNKIFLKTQV